MEERVLWVMGFSAPELSTWSQRLSTSHASPLAQVPDMGEWALRWMQLPAFKVPQLTPSGADPQVWTILFLFISVSEVPCLLETALLIFVISEYITSSETMLSPNSPDTQGGAYKIKTIFFFFSIRPGVWNYYLMRNSGKLTLRFKGH